MPSVALNRFGLRHSAVAAVVVVVFIVVIVLIVIITNKTNYPLYILSTANRHPLKSLFLCSQDVVIASILFRNPVLGKSHIRLPVLHDSYYNTTYTLRFFPVRP